MLEQLGGVGFDLETVVGAALLAVGRRAREDYGSLQSVSIVRCWKLASVTGLAIRTSLRA